MCGSTSNTTTTQPNPQVAANYADVTAQAKQVASTPYQPYTGELTAGINQGQSDAIGELQGGYGLANPYLNSGSSYLNNASGGLGNVQNYLQAASGLGNISGNQSAQAGALQNSANFLDSSYNTSGQMAGAYNASAGMATPQAFNNGAALNQYMNPYTQNVINATMANAQQQDAIQGQQLNSNAIGQGAYGGDRAGIAQSSLAGQQALANNSTLAGLENQNYSQALSQYNTGVAQQQQGASLLQGVGAGYGQQANIAGNIGQAYQALAGQYGTAGQQQLQQASLYNTLGQTQGQTAQAYGTLAGQSGNLGNIAQSTNTAGASAALQASTLQQQNQQAQDAAAYGQFQNAIQYPFQTTSYLANIDEGIGSNSGSSTTSPGPSLLSQGVGAATAGLGILGAVGGSGGVSAGYNTIANGISSLFARGGAVQPRSTFARGGGLGGLDLRRGFDAGGTPGLNFNGSGLLGTNNPTAGTIGGTMPLAVRQQPMQIMAQNPGAQQPAAQPASSGLGAASFPSFSATDGSTQPDSSGLASTDPNQKQNMYMALAAAGLGMMGGTSPQAGVNIGQGGLAGVREYTALQQQDRENQIARSGLALKQQASAIELAQFQRSLQAAGALSGLAGGTPSASATIPGSTAPAAPLAAPSAGLGGLAPIATSSSPAGLGALASPSAGSSAPVAPAPATATDPTASAAPAGGDFWSGVPQESNPFWLANQAHIATYYGQPEIANKYLTMRDQILQQGTVLRNGQVTPIPGSVTSSATKAGADAAATETGKQSAMPHTVYDQDGNPQLVDGPTFSKVAQTGMLNGSPVTAVQSPYAVASVDNYKEFSKNAVAFNKDYQPNLYSLQSLAKIYQSYQGGRGAEAVADLDSYAKQFGLEKLLPANWQNTSAGFDAALKTATSEGFKTLQDSGITRAPATGLREVLLTVPRPDADPAARQKVITDTIANLNYQHDMINNIATSGDHNIYRAQNNFMKGSNYGDYVNGARAGTPVGGGVTPGAANTVFGQSGSAALGTGVPNGRGQLGQAPSGAAPPSDQSNLPSPPRQPTAPSGPAVGTVSKGYTFTGGDPSSPTSWQRVQ